MSQNERAYLSHNLRGGADTKLRRNWLHRSLTVGALAALLGACATTEPTDTMDERKILQERYLVDKVKLPSTFAEIQQSLFRHREACDIYFKLQPDPQQVHFATLVYGVGPDGDPQNSIMADLRATSSGNVHIDTYSYYAQNRDLARALIAALSDPQQCPRSDEKN